MKHFQPVGVSLIGKVRKRNEDSFIFTNDPSHKNQIAVIADGIGSCKHGDLASRFASEVFFRKWETAEAADFKTLAEMENFMLEAIQYVNSELFRLNQSTIEYQECHIGTTLVAVAIMEKYLVAVHAGDSRFYEFTNKGELIQHTEDHTLLTKAKKFGKLDLHGVSEAEYGHILTKAVGVREEINSVKRLVQSFKRNPKSRYLICSDGLSHQLKDETIANILAETTTNEAALNKLILATYLAGADDNLTIVLW